MSIQSALSQAIKVQALREDVTLTDVAKRSGISASAFFDRTENRKDWTTVQINSVANALNLKDGWELIDLAKNEEKSPQVLTVGNETRKE